MKIVRSGDAPQRLEFPAGISTPAVLLDAENGKIEMRGESYPENSPEFFRPVLDWLGAFFETGGATLAVELNLSYINTGSIKCLMDLFDTLEDAHRAGRTVSVKWLYAVGNPRSLEAAEEFREDVSFPFVIAVTD